MTRRPGQIALIVILVVVVGLTVAVSVLSRSVTTVSISTKEQEKARSFSAAEAGIEDALRQDLSTITGDNFAVGSGGESNVSYAVSKISTEIQTKISPGRTITIDWTVSTAPAASVSWINSDNPGCPVLVAKEITSIGGVKNIISATSPYTLGKDDHSLTRIRITGCSTDTSLTINPIGPNTLSFYQIDSTGVSSDSQSKVQVIRSEPAPIGLLDYAIFSGGSIN